MATKFPPAYKFKFRAGPYTPPAVAVGQVVHDERFGDVTVEGMTDGPIRWPGFRQKKMGRHGGLMPILFAGLVRAVAEEEAVVVAHYWGVARNTVVAWKRAVADCDDSNAVFAALSVKRMDPAFRRKFY